MVKSRLGAVIGDEAALGLYRCFVDDMIRTLSQGNYMFTIFYYPSRSRAAIARWLGHDREIFPQHGSDLGQRMKNAFKDILSHGNTSAPAVLIGSDMPDLPAYAIDEALSSLADHDAVLGPSPDGGYYLIGFKPDTFLPEVFEGIPWSTPAVFEQTLAVFERFNYRVYIMQERQDIDTFEDLNAFYSNNLASSLAPATTTYIRSHIPRISRNVLHEHKTR